MTDDSTTVTWCGKEAVKVRIPFQSLEQFESWAAKIGLRENFDFFHENTLFFNDVYVCNLWFGDARIAMMVKLIFA